MMHPFALSKAACLFIMLAVITSGALRADSTRNIDDLAEQIRKTDAQLEALKQRIDQNTIIKQDLQSAFEAARDKRFERDERLAELDRQITLFNATLTELQHSVDNASQAIEQRKSELALALQSSQRVGAASNLKPLLKHDDPGQAQRLAVYREYFFRAQQKQLTHAIAYLKRIEDARLSALKDRNWLEYIKSKAAGQRENFARDVDESRQKIDQVNTELEQSTRTVAQLQADHQRLQRLMEELESLQRDGSDYFASLQGDIELPVTGEVIARFGDIKSVGKLRWEGLFIKSRDGARVQAVADGEVVYSDWLQGFGMLVIVDHGDGYMTLYGGNRSVAPTKGTWVESGATIATVGDSGGQNTSGLYFEIRHNAKALDPQDWLKPASS